MKPLFWMGSSLKDLKALPQEVQRVLGRELMDVQFGGQLLNAKPMKGLGSRVYEIVEDFDTNTYRGVYTVRFADAVYALHVFQKKSRRGSETPQHEIDLIRNRLRQAEEHYQKWRETNEQ
jgi:phage-related protein